MFEDLSNCPQCLKDIIKPTYGIMLYQEQVMAVCQQYAGFNEVEADDVRSALGKKLPEKMAKMGKLFISKSIEKGYKKEDAQKIFETLEKYASYSFNKCIPDWEETISSQGIKTIKELRETDLQKNKIFLFSSNREKNKIEEINFGGNKEVFRFTLENGKSFCSTIDHTTLTIKDGKKILLPLSQIVEEGLDLVYEEEYTLLNK